MKIKQHVIPNFMIKRWASNNHFNTWNKNYSAVETISLNSKNNPFIKDNVYEHELNSSNEVENILSKIEGSFSKFTNNLIKKIQQLKKQISVQTLKLKIVIVDRFHLKISIWKINF